MTLTLHTLPIKAAEESAREETVYLQLPDDPAAQQAFRERLAVTLYDLRAVSQGTAAQIAGLTRAGFIDALGRHGVTPFQYEDAEDALSDLETLQGARARAEAQTGGTRTEPR